MLKNPNGSTFVEVPHDPVTAKKCEFIFIIAYAAFPSGISIDAMMFENEEAFFSDTKVHIVHLDNFDIDVRSTDLYDVMHEKALGYFPGFEVCQTPKPPEPATDVLQEGLSGEQTTANYG